MGYRAGHVRYQFDLVKDKRTVFKPWASASPVEPDLVSSDSAFQLSSITCTDNQNRCARIWLWDGRNRGDPLTNETQYSLEKIHNLSPIPDGQE